MSLLLEALKKAEKAKEDAQRRARGEPAEAPPPPAAPVPAMPEAPAELRLEGDALPPPEAPRVTTRAELPDLTAPIEIVADELRAKTPPPRELRLEPSKEAPRRPAAAAQPTDRPSQAGTQSPDRDPQRTAARKVFEAKFKEPNPKLPFYITLGALGVFAVGIVVYFWWQLRPPYPLVNLNPPRSSSEAQAAAAPAAPAPSAPAPSAPASSAIPGLPGGALPQPAPQPAPQAMQPSPTPAVPRPSAPRTPAVLPPEKPLLAPPAGPEVAVSRTAPQVHPRVDAGYAAYQAGDLAKARAEYEQALSDEPTNRDALLGMAAVETRSGRYGAAEAAYLRLLQVDPRDSHAQAGLLALRSARLDPLAAESRVKSMLAQDPAAHALNFALGNQLAQQGRWAEAQQEYFKAFAADPENADFAYNLAVALDHLRQPRLAREYYQRAISLAEKRGASFDLAMARARAAALGAN
jgi:tetratricopeptide (TPR) repeat protein